MPGGSSSCLVGDAFMIDKPSRFDVLPQAAAVLAGLLAPPVDADASQVTRRRLWPGQDNFALAALFTSTGRTFST